MFRLWFQAQTLTTKRQVVRERLVAYVNDPIAKDILDAMPGDVRNAFNHAIDVARQADWSVTN